MSLAARAAGWRQWLANPPGPWASAATAGGSVPVLVLAYDEVLARVRLSVSGLNATAATVLVDRSTDGIRWTTVRGGNGKAVFSAAAALDDYEFSSDVAVTYRVRSYSSTAALLDTITGSITASLGGIWLKFLARPFLNRPVTMIEFGPVGRRARHGVFDVVGRSDPIGVTDVRGSRQQTVQLRTDTLDEADELDLLLASGEVVFWHAPASCPVPTRYALIGDTSQDRRSRRGERRYFELPLIQAAAPGPDVVGATATCQTVLNAYSTCADVLAAHATCASLLELIGDPSEVIVP